MPPEHHEPHGEMQVLAEHHTLARFEGIHNRRCRGLTTACPDRCGESGGFASFSIVQYIEYRKLGQYGDPKQRQFAFRVTDHHQRPIGDPHLLRQVGELRKGEPVILAWHHVYGEVAPGSFQPERPVIELRKLNPEEAARYRNPNANRGNEAAPNLHVIPNARVIPNPNPNAIGRNDNARDIGEALMREGDPRNGGLTIETLSITSADRQLNDGRRYDAFPFTMSAGEVISVAMTKVTKPGTRYPAIHPQMDPVLVLVDPQGRRVAQDDNGAGNGLNARLHFKAPQAGKYTIYATTKHVEFYGPPTYRLNVWIYLPQMLEIRR